LRSRSTHDILKIPNAALRFTPPPDPAAAAATPGSGGAAPQGQGPGPGPASAGSSRAASGSRAPAGPVALQVSADATDGTWTPDGSGDLKEGQEVIVGVMIESIDPSQTSNPFGRSRGGSGGGRGMR
jgi:HlyD family secretion protein